MSAAGLVSILGSAVGSSMRFLSSFWLGPVGKYRPEDHYMRGPGPKWREKHFVAELALQSPATSVRVNDCLARQALSTSHCRA
jgi:hypothetical protein